MKESLGKRILLFIFSLGVTALSVAMISKAQLGVSPVSVIPNVISLKFTTLSLGTCMIFWNCILIAGQILILRREFRLVQLLQFLIAFIFGFFTDAAVQLLSGISVITYPQRVLLDVLGIIIGAVGISLAVIANVIMNSAEALISVISNKLHKNFGDMKNCFDFICVVIAMVLSLFFFRGKLIGIREGTILSAILSGRIVKICLKHLKGKLDQLLY